MCYKEFLEALVKGDVDKVAEIIRAREDVSGFLGGDDKELGQFSDPSALTIAAEHGQNECVRKILEMGGNLYSVGTTDEDEAEEERRVCEARTYISDDYFGALLQASLNGHVKTLHLLATFRLFEVPGLQEEYGEFVKAAEDGDFKRIGALLESVEDKDVYLKGWKGHNIMNLCLLMGCPQTCIQAMLDNGISASGWDYNGLTPLMCAILGKNVECVRFLLDQGSDPYDIHIVSRISFHNNGRVDLYDDFGESMQLSSDPEDKYTDFYQCRVGCTALMFAAAIADVPILEMMLKAAPKDNIGCPSRFEQYEGTRPLHFALYYASLEVVSLIQENEDPEDDIEPDEGPLCRAIIEGNTKFINLFFDRLVSQKDWPCEKSMETCIAKGNLECFKKILEARGKSKIKSRRNVFKADRGKSYFAAIEKNATDFVDLFTKLPEFKIDMKGTDDLNDSHGLTSFLFSCRKGKIELAKKFLDMGANLNTRNAKGKTAVMYAAREERVECLEFLLDLKANFDAMDKSGGTVFSAALMAEKGSSLEFLLKSGLVLEKGDLKPVHKKSVKVFGGSGYEDGFNWDKKAVPIRNILLLIQYKLFDWDWCTVVDNLSLHNILFSAVTSGISPGKLKHNKQNVSPIVYAVLTKDIKAVRYLLANRYFLPEDYKFLSSDASVKKMLNFDEAPDMSFLVEQLTLRPLSLEAWNVMTISESMASSDSAENSEKKRRVDTLPLPEPLKNMLKSKNKFSQLCPRHWKRLGPRKGENEDGKFNVLVVDGEVVSNPCLKECKKEDCACGGMASTVDGIDDKDDIRRVGEEDEDEEDEGWEDADDGADESD